MLNNQCENDDALKYLKWSAKIEVLLIKIIMDFVFGLYLYMWDDRSLMNMKQLYPEALDLAHRSSKKSVMLFIHCLVYKKKHFIKKAFWRFPMFITSCLLRDDLTCACYLYCQDNQVPVCPLCNCPVPLGASASLPDEVVGRHIDNDCQSETAQSRRKVNAVSLPVLRCL